MSNTYKYLYLLYLFSITGLSACSMDNVFNPTIKNTEDASVSKDANRSLADRDQSEDKLPEQLASEPVMTGGAFLTCELIDPQTWNATEHDFQCRLELEGSKALIAASYELQAQLMNENEELIPVEVIDDAPDSPWHWSFSINRQVFASAYLAVSIFDPDTGYSQSYIHDLNMSDSQAVENNGALLLTALKEHTNRGPDDGRRGGERPANRPQWLDGRKNFPDPVEFTIPERILVTKGNAGNRLTTIRFDQLQCTYRGGADINSPIRVNDPVQIEKGLFYEFESCGTFQAGDAVSANTVVLHIDDGDKAETTEVQVSISMANLAISGDDDDDD